MSQISNHAKSPEWINIVASANDDGPVVIPYSLIKLFSLLTDPTACIELNVISEARKHLFLLNCLKKDLSEDYKLCMHALFRWVFREIEFCSKETSNANILSCVFIAAYFGSEFFWENFPSCNNNKFFQKIIDFVQNIKFEIYTPSKAFLYEQNLCKNLKIAMNKRNYIELNKNLPFLIDKIQGKPMLISCWHALAYHQWNMFVDMIDGFSGNNLLNVANIIKVLLLELRHRLLLDTKNPDVIYLISCQFRREIDINNTYTRIIYLIDMFKKTSENLDIWVALNKNYFCYLNLFMEEQIALAIIMSSIDKSKMDVLLKNIDIRKYPFFIAQKTVAYDNYQFFNTFEQYAGDIIKKYFFENIYNVYNKTINTKLVHSIFSTNIDYGIYLYYVLYISTEKKYEILKNILLGIKNINIAWFNSKEEYQNLLSLYLSEFQIIYRAIYIEREQYQNYVEKIFIPSFLKGDYFYFLFNCAISKNNIQYVIIS